MLNAPRSGSYRDTVRLSYSWATPCQSKLRMKNMLPENGYDAGKFMAIASVQQIKR
jgi:hypothetical protein